MSGGITPITQITSVTQAQTAKNGNGVGSITKDFSKVLGNAVNNLAEKENSANNAIVRLAAGEDVNLHQVMLSMQEADIAFQIALQTRNKLVDAYREIMRMQV